MGDCLLINPDAAQSGTPYVSAGVPRSSRHIHSQLLRCVRLLSPSSCCTRCCLQIGKVLAIIKPDNGDEIQLKVNWFYRPEEAVGGRKVTSSSSSRQHTLGCRQQPCMAGAAHVALRWASSWCSS